MLCIYFGDWVRREGTRYRAAIGELARWAAAGKLSCHVHRAYPLAEMPQALEALTQRSVMGKVIVQP